MQLLIFLYKLKSSYEINKKLILIVMIYHIKSNKIINFLIFTIIQDESIFRFL